MTSVPIRSSFSNTANAVPLNNHELDMLVEKRLLESENKMMIQKNAASALQNKVADGSYSSSNDKLLIESIT